MHSFTGRNDQYCASLSGVSLDNLSTVIKAAPGPTCAMCGLVLISLGLIAELLSVKHQYTELPRFHVDELDKLIEFLCCN